MIIVVTFCFYFKPALPPEVSTSVYGIEHPNIFGNYICCDLLETQEEIIAEKGYTGGYTPALTLRGLFLQFLTFFSSNSVCCSYSPFISRLVD